MDWLDLLAVQGTQESSPTPQFKSINFIYLIGCVLIPTKVRRVKAVVFPVGMYGYEIWTIKKAEPKELMLLNCGVGKDSWEFLGQQADPTCPS